MERHGRVNEITARRKGRRGRVLPGVPEALQVPSASWAGTCKASCIQLLTDICAFMKMLPQIEPVIATRMAGNKKTGVKVTTPSILKRRYITRSVRYSVTRAIRPSTNG